MKYASEREAGRLFRKARIRKSVVGTPMRPRLSVFKSAKHLYAQLIDDQTGKTLAAASTVDKELKTGKIRGNLAGAVKVGTLVAKRAKAAGIETVLFDRNGFRYHGTLKALADAAREGGLKF